MQILLIAVVLVGMFAVGLAFVVLIPLVGKLLVAVFTTVVVERVAAWRQGRESHSVIRKPTSGQVEPLPPRPHPHLTPTWVYGMTYVALLGLTVVTVGVSGIGMSPRGAVLTATLIALMKASLVVGLFMHLWHEKGMYKLALATSLFFVVVFFGLTMADVTTRGWGLQEQDYEEFMEDSFEAKRTPPGWSRRGGN